MWNNNTAALGDVGVHYLMKLVETLENENFHGALLQVPYNKSSAYQFAKVKETHHLGYHRLSLLHFQPQPPTKHP